MFNTIINSVINVYFLNRQRELYEVQREHYERIIDMLRKSNEVKDCLLLQDYPNNCSELINNFKDKIKKENRI